MRDTAVTFDGRILTDEIFSYNYPRTISDLINTSAFLGDGHTLKLIRPWFSSLEESDVLLRTRTHVLPFIPLEVFSVGLTMSMLEDESSVVTTDLNLSLIMTDIMKRDFSADADLIQKAISHIYDRSNKDRWDGQQLFHYNAYNHVTRVISVGSRTYVSFNDEDERLIAYYEMEQEHAETGNARFVPTRKQTLNVGDHVPWAKDIEHILPRYRLNRHARR